MREIFFGNEDDPGARFIQLQDCRHVLEVEGLDQWMDLSEHSKEGAVDIQLKCCPKCKTPVRRSRRYGAFVNRTLADLEKVKNRMIGDTAKIKSAKQNIMKTLEATGYMSLVWKYSRSFRLEDMWIRVFDENLSLEEATCLHNISNLLLVLCKLRDKSTDVDDSRLVEEIDDVLEWALTSRHRLTEQEQTDMSCETRRLTLRTTAAQLTPLINKGHGDVGQSLVTDFDTAVQLLTSGSPVNEAQLDKAESTLEEIRKVLRVPLSDVEKLQIVKTSD